MSMEILIWQARTKKKITLVQLAQQTGLSKSTLNNLENEKNPPTLLQLEQIASALDCHIQDLYKSKYK